MVICPILLISLSYVTLLSTSELNARNQVLFFILGSIGYVILTFLDIEVYKQFWLYLQSAAVLLLIITFLLGTAKFGSTRWIDLGFFTFQPSEFAKITTILSLAAVISKTKDAMANWKTILTCGAIVIPVILSIIIQPDLGTAVVILTILVGILFYCGLNKWYFVILLLFVGIFSAPAWNLLKDYQRSRILVFLNPTLDTQGAGYNVIQSIVTVGSGGIFGKGFGHGTQTHLGFLPAFFTDFALASFVEEWGFVGFVSLLVIYATLLVSILYTAFKCRTTFESITAVGFFIIFLLQFIINIGMNLGIMPVKGIPLPIFSYGGSSMLSSLFMLGILQNFDVHKKS